MSRSRYSIFSLARNAYSHHRNWPKAWRSPEPKSAYDVIIVGGGGHGLATAYYLAKEHGLTNVAVLEKGGLAEEIQVVIQLLSVPTICGMKVRQYTKSRCSYMKD